MKQHEQQPSEAIEEFLNYVDQCRMDYQMAREAVGVEDKRLQDLVHEMEFADGKNEKGRAATKLQQSRKYRRKQKDEVLRLKELVEFFDQQNHKNTLNKMRQLLGKQRKTEEYLDGQRKYKPRVKEE